MPTLDFDRLHEAVLVRVTGSLGARELLDTIHRLLDDPRYTPGMPALWDLRDSDLETMSAATMRHVHHATAPYQKAFARSRVALLVSSELAFGVARMYEVLVMEDMLEHRSFRELDAAERWIREGTETRAVEARVGYRGVPCAPSECTKRRRPPRSIRSLPALPRAQGAS